MRQSSRVHVLLVGACLMTGIAAWGQQAQSPKPTPTPSIDVAVVYDPLVANVVGGNVFSMQGGSVQVHGQFWRGLGVVADLSGLHTASASGSSGVGWIWLPPPSARATPGRQGNAVTRCSVSS